MRSEIQTGPQNLGDSVLTTARGGRQGEAIVSLAHSRYFEPTFRGAMFTGSTPAAGVTLPIFSNLTQQFGLYNPQGSGVVAVLKRCMLGYVSGTHVAGHVCYAYRTAVGVGEAAPATVTVVTPVNTLLGGGAAPKCRIYSPVTIATAAIYLRPMGLSQVVQPATGVNAPWMMVDELDGEIILGDNTMLFVACNVAAGLGAVAAALSWEEVPGL